MASVKSSNNPFPAGWDCRVDNYTGKRFVYIAPLYY